MDAFDFVPRSVIPLAYHPHFSTCGAQLLVSDEHGVTLVPPGLRRDRERESGNTVASGGAKKWESVGGCGGNYSGDKTEMDTVVSAPPQVDAESRLDCSWQVQEEFRQQGVAGHTGPLQTVVQV